MKIKIITYLLFQISCLNQTFCQIRPPEQTIMKQEIFSKTLNSVLSVHAYRLVTDVAYSWEISLIQKSKSSSINFTIMKDDLRRSGLINREDELYKKLIVSDVILKEGTNVLYILIDKFGQVDLHEYVLDNNLAFKKIPPIIIPFSTYDLIPMDQYILSETIEDIALYKRKLLAISRSPKHIFDSYFINVLDLDKHEKKVYSIDIITLKHDVKGIGDDHIQSLSALPWSEIDLIRVLQAVKQKSAYANRVLSYKYSLLSSRFKECFMKHTKISEDAFFFLDIDQKPMIMLYTNLNEWYICDESIMKPADINIKNRSYSFDRMIKYD